MPTDPYNKILGTEWIKGATRFLGIPLYPLGEINIMDFIMESPEDKALIRQRLFGFQCQVACMIVLAYIFANNLFLSVKMLVANARKLSSWCCLISSCTGVGLGLVASQIMTPTGLNCRTLVWYVVWGLTCSLVCCSAIILQNAYVALCKPRWVIIVGIIFMLPQMSYAIFVTLFSRFTVQAYNGCVSIYPLSMPWYWFGSVAPINILFSSIFCYTIYQQYRLFGSEAWRRLTRDGIRTMSVVVLCNIFCGTSIIFNLGGTYSEMFFLMDWLITSTILVRHCYNMRRMFTLSHQPKTENVLHLSQIVTANPFHSI